MVWTAATAGPVPGVRTSGPSLVGSAPPGTVSVGFSPNAPATLTPELTEEADGDAAEDGDEPPQAARAGATSRPAVSTRALRRVGRWDSFTRNLRLLGERDATTVRAEPGRFLYVPLLLPRGDAMRHHRRGERGAPVRLDLNADVAESFGRWRLGDDDAVLPLLTSANVACGFHAGDARTIRETVMRCAALGVVVGAQVSYRDLAGFGRRAMDVDAADLEADVLYQVAAVAGLARIAGVRARYVKPHGALYHRVLDDDEQASAVVAAVAAWDAGAAVLTQPGELARQAAAAGVAGRAAGV